MPYVTEVSHAGFKLIASYVRTVPRNRYRYEYRSGATYCVQ